MVDNENQWDDIEYSEGIDSMDYEESDVESAEYSEDGYAGDEDYEGYEEELDEEPQKKGGCSVLLLLLLIIVVGVGAFIFFNKQKETPEKQTPVAQETTVQQTTDSTEMGDYFFNEANGGSEDMMSVNFDENGSTNVVTQSDQGEIVANVKETPEENKDLNINGEENAIMVSYTRPVRLNPFKPTDVPAGASSSSIINDTGFEIVEPPVSSVPDENLTKLLQTQISGILYDDESPSAIVNLNGVDQFVKIGDNVGGYLIEGISRNQVQISYKSNTYVASVGELFTRGALENRQAVVNLENKFAGRNRNNN